MEKFGTDNLNTQDKSVSVEKAIRNYSNLIFLTAYQSLKNYYDAEDIMQEVSVALVTGNPPFGDETHLKNWIVKVTLNKCINFKKSRKIRNTVPLDDYLNLQAPKARRMMEELWQLPDNYRNIIYLYYYHSYKISEIAQILNKSPNTIGSNLRRARKKLKKILEEGENNYV